MMFNGNDFVNPMMGGFGLIGMAIYAIFMLIAVAVSVGLTIIVVRFLLITTKAAQLYIAKNSPTKVAVSTAAAPAAPTAATAATAATASTASAASASSSAMPTTATPPPATAKATTPVKPRTPKTPPTT